MHDVSYIKKTKKENIYANTSGVIVILPYHAKFSHSDTVFITVPQTAFSQMSST